jgi:PAS domain S-box-containing protein
MTLGQSADTARPIVAESVFVFAPVGRDASLTCQFLVNGGVAAQSCSDMTSLCQSLTQAPAAILLTQEALCIDVDRRRLIGALNELPDCADLPILVLTRRSDAVHPDPDELEILASIDNVTLVPRPVHAATLLGVVRSVLRARRHRHERSERMAGSTSTAGQDDHAFRELIDDNPLPTLVAVDGSVVYANRNAIVLLAAGNAAAVSGQSVCRWVQGDFVDAMQTCMNGLLLGEHPPTVMQQKWLCAGNALTDIEVNVSAVPWDGRRAVLMLLRDITEAVQARASLHLQAEELTRADQRKNEFIALLAHELRNPLAPIHNAVHVLKIQPDPPDPGHYRWATDVINRQVHHITRLADDLLDMARITHGRIKLQKETLELGPILLQAIESVRPLTASRKQTVAYSVPLEPMRLEADATRLAQVVGNLLANASRYTPPSGHIALSSAREGSEAVITVSDDGIGIPPQTLAEIFEPFRQGERPPGYAQAGLGLGLALVKRLVALHGGSVHAYSEGAGKGSVFTVRLPALAEARAGTEEGASTGSAYAAGCRILVVDDDPDVAQSFAVLLSYMGHQVQATNNAVAALAAARSFEPHVAFVDIGLPDMDGFALADALQRATRQALRLVALTGYARAEVRQHVAGGRFAAYLRKPVTAETVTKLLASFDAADKAGSANV